MDRRSFVRTALTVTPMLALDPTLLWRTDRKTEREIQQFVRQLRRAMRQMLRDQTPDEEATLAIGTPLSAATITTDTVVLTPQLRNAGLYTSPTFSVPASITDMRLFANIGLADKLSIGKLCDLMLQRSPDGVMFTDSAGFGWGSYGPEGYHTIGKDGQPIDNPDPSLGYHNQGNLSDQFRLQLTLPQPLVLGATVEIMTG